MTCNQYNISDATGITLQPKTHDERYIMSRLYVCECNVQACKGSTMQIPTSPTRGSKGCIELWISVRDCPAHAAKGGTAQMPTLPTSGRRL